jgi:pSer/pThr/pTyr-binding forkhead associated (FHA) protein
MSAASDFTETLALTWLLTANSATRPSAWYIGLHTADPTDAGTGAEISGNGYIRKSVAFGISGDTASNSATVTFDAATGNWGTITHIGVWDSETGGNLLFHGAVTTSKTIDQGDTFQISSGNLDITLA